jgi:hypothetical protein
VNALEIKATLQEEVVNAPAPLFEKYPDLVNSAKSEDNEPKLFA